MTKQLDTLLEKEKKLKAQIQQAKSLQRTSERKRQTRRQVLIGAAVLARVEAGLWPREELLTMMDRFLTRPNERELFELEAQVAGVDESSQPDSKTASNQTLPVAQKQRTQHLPQSNPASGFDGDDFQL